VGRPCSQPRLATLPEKSLAIVREMSNDIYRALFSASVSGDSAPSIVAINSPLQTDYTTAALTYGAPSTETAQVLNVFVAGSDFLANANSGVAQSAKALALQFGAAADGAKATLLEKLQTLAADPQAAIVERRLSDSLLATYWLPKRTGWDVRGLIQARKALAVRAETKGGVQRPGIRRSLSLLPRRQKGRGGAAEGWCHRFRERAKKGSR